LTNGWTHLASLEVGDMDGWSIPANAGDSIIARMGEMNGTLTPQLRLYDPNGVLLDTGAGAIAGEVAVRATNSGTFLLIAGDQTAGLTGSGTYRLTMAKTASPLTISATDEGGVLTNGLAHLGSIEAGDMDAWSIPAIAGESIVVRMGEITSTLTPQLRLYDPSGALIKSSSAAAAAEVSARATNTGTFLLVASDLTAGWAGTGNYRLTLAKTGSPVAVGAQDEGGALVNGTTYQGAIEVGDIDAWTLQAKAGESIVVRMGEVSSATFTPQLRIFDPSGAELAEHAAAAAAEVSIRATNSGSFLIVAGDLTAGWAGRGNYRLTTVKTGTPLATSPGQEGGPMSGLNAYEGTLELGALDGWSFTACAGDAITLRLTKLVASSTLTPWLRLYGRDGVELRSASGAAAAELTVTAPANGTYTLVVGDRTAGYAGSGGYRLTATGLTHSLRICLRGPASGGFAPLVIGGVPAAPCKVLATTDPGLPLAQWRTVLTSEYDDFGLLSLRELFDPAEQQLYFQVESP
jgi:hypothetical protein